MLGSGTINAIGLTLLILLLSCGSFSQNKTAVKPDVVEKAADRAGAVEPLEIAKGTLAAHGGDKLKKMTSLVMRGSVDLNVFNQSTPATFSTVISGEKYFFEILNPFQPLKQIYNGRQTFSSIQGFSLPPITSLGFPLLLKVGDAGYPVSALAEGKKKRTGFRITTPEGFYTDFLIDEKSKQIKGYESSYDVGGRIVTTSVVVDEFQTVDGVVIPKKYSQRFDIGQMTAYANFKVKEVLVNSPLADDVFAMPK